MKITVPFFVARWLVPKRVLDELRERSKVSGKASTGKEWGNGAISVQVTVDRPSASAHTPGQRTAADRVCRPDSRLRPRPRP